jgi:hypothetical protein
MSKRPYLRLPWAERLAAYTRRTDDCWLWCGTVRPDGYGVIRIDGRTVRAHRVAWYLDHGSWPLGVLRHTCDTPLCVRPEHLRDGTHQENVGDRVERGRGARGERMGSARLTSHAVLWARRKRLEGWSYEALARYLGVGRETIRRAVRCESWTHI